MADTESMREERVDGVPVIMPEFGCKTFTMVVKSVGYFTHKTSPTYFRTSGVMETNYGGQPKVGKRYPAPSAERVMALYLDNAIDEFGTVVVSPGLEAACYIGRALNAPILPSQFIASAPTREFVERHSSPDNIYVVGHETDWPELCVWIKPANIGGLYSNMIEKAKTVVIFSADSGPENLHGTSRGWFKDNIHILDGCTGDGNFRARIQDPGKNGYADPHDLIPHWEFSMEDGQISNLEAYCRQRGKRTVTIRAGDWRGFLPAMLFQRLYEKSGYRPSGITFHGYWACHPFYESEFLRMPVIDFQHGAGPYVEEFRTLMDAIEWEKKDGEYLVWPPELNTTGTKNPAAIFESWGFPTVYRTDRPYDCWCYGWEQEPDPRNPTREWIVPKLKDRRTFRDFLEYVTIDELIDIAKRIRKTEVTVHS